MRRFSVSLVGSALVVGLAAQGARAAEISVKQTQGTLLQSGAASGRALAIGITNLPAGLGPIQLTLGQNDASLSTNYVRNVDTKALLDDALFIACGSGPTLNPVLIQGQQRCLDRSALAQRGLSLPDARDLVQIEELSKAGVATLRDDVLAENLKTDAAAKATGVLVDAPAISVAETSAVCSAAKPVDKPAPGRTLPPPIDEIIGLEAAIAACELTTKAGFPTLTESSGVAEVDLNLTTTIVKNVPQLNTALDSLQQQLEPLPASLRDPVNNAIDNIQREVSSQPLFTLALGPNDSSIASAADSVLSTSQSRAVVLSILNGLATVEVASAKASAGVAGSGAIAPTAKADPALVRVKVLNITLPNPAAGAPVIDVVVDPRNLHEALSSVPGVAGVIEANDQEIVLFRGLPLETHISFATGKEYVDASARPTCTLPGDSSGSVFNSVASASAVKILAFGKPSASGSGVEPASAVLPLVDVRLAEAQAASARSTPTQVQAALPLARTGALPASTAGAGMVVAGLAALVRRRFVR
jgi:hypothetical protein